MNVSVISGLILKDLYNLKKSIGILLLFLLAYGCFSIATDEPTMVLGLIIAFCLILPASAFNFDRATNWNSYALTLTVSRRQLVTARYGFICLLIVVMMSIFLALTLIGLEFFEGELTNALLSTGASAATLLLLISLYIPIMYRLGPDRARFVFIAIALLPTILILLFTKLAPAGLTDSMQSWFFEMVTILPENSAFFVPAALLFLSLITLWISWKLSCKIIEKQEF